MQSLCGFDLIGSAAVLAIRFPNRCQAHHCEQSSSLQTPRKRTGESLGPCLLRAEKRLDERGSRGETQPPSSILTAVRGALQGPAPAPSPKQALLFPAHAGIHRPGEKQCPSQAVKGFSSSLIFVSSEFIKFLLKSRNLAVGLLEL